MKDINELVFDLEVLIERLTIQVEEGLTISAEETINRINNKINDIKNID